MSGEALTVHCERCGRECSPPSEEQIREHEEKYGPMKDPEFVCTICLEAAPGASVPAAGE
jgi:hypothetical protein